MIKPMLAALMIALPAVAGAQQLQLIEQDYAQARRMAQEQHKLLLIDFYTTWCMPCKVLDKTIFKNDSMARMIGRDFVVLRYDAERDTPYHLSLKHHICSYPTTLILTPEGKLIDKMFGTGGAGSLADNYRKLLRESISLHRQGRYIEGVAPGIDPDAYPEFYKRYVRRIADIKAGELERYWAGNTALQSEVSLAVLAYFGKASEQLRTYFVQHKADYERRFGKKDIAFILERMVAEGFQAAARAKDPAAYAAAEGFAREHLAPADTALYLESCRLDWYMATDHWQQAAALLTTQRAQDRISDNQLNYFCWSVYEQCSDTQVINQAVLWMKTITDRQPSYAWLDTYARLLAKRGDSAAAIAAMQKAIAMGKAEGADTAESEAAMKQF